MEKIIDREIAWRIFAHEFNRSNLYVSEGTERAPNYIITPTGVKCNRLFIIGVVTEVENIGQDKSLWKARIADPTGVFTLYAGQYQPEAAIFLSELNVPAYVAVVGKARKYEPESGSLYVSVRPEEINTADEKQRDRWVLDTAELTFQRIKIIEEALASGRSGNDLKDFLLKNGKNAVLAEGAVMAIEHYRNPGKIIEELKSAVVHAVRTIAVDSPVKYSDEAARTPEKIKQPPEQKTGDIEKKMELIEDAVSEAVGTLETDIKKTGNENEIETEPEPKEIVAAIIDKLDKGKGTTYASVLEAALSAGMDGESVESGIKELMAEGRCYEPKIGVLRKV
ncbi:MAG TPA: hypothetical protein VIO58_06630 [Candidatus Methanoperedens sp.]